MAKRRADCLFDWGTVVVDSKIKPTPGSKEAKKLGCKCPRMDNSFGRGAWGTSGKDAVFWISEGCDLHSK